MIKFFELIFTLFNEDTLFMWIPLAAIMVLAILAKLLFSRSRYK